MQHLGGSMYGDGVVVVDFSGVDSDLGPMSATMFVIATGNAYSATLPDHRRPSVALARLLATRAMVEERRLDKPAEGR